MELTLYRVDPLKDCTIGKLYCGDTFICDTLEDKDRGLKDSWELATILAIKVPHETAIPTGSYEIEITYSDHFKKPLPHIINVKGFEGVRIHSGNKNADTSGCVLVGERLHPDSHEIVNSRKTFDRVYDLIGKALLNERVYITIQK